MSRFMAENIAVTKNQKVRFSAYGRINRFFFFCNTSAFRRYSLWCALQEEVNIIGCRTSGGP